MKINGSPIESLRPLPATAPIGDSGDTPATSPTAPVKRREAPPDSVHISDAGRALASDGATKSTDSLSPERVAQLRRNVLDGAYNSTKMADQVARRMLDSNDV